MKLITFPAAILVLLSAFSHTEGIICLSCSGRNARECSQQGIYVHCQLREICSTSVTRHGHTFYTTKRCQQREACLNEQKQNWKKVNNIDRTCNSNTVTSTCRCCCHTDYCNKNERCTAAIESERGISSCPPLVETFLNGRRRCSNSNLVGSVCNYRCSNGYQVNPRYNQQITCLPNGKWNMLVPCCSRPCPPNLFVDLAIVRYFKNHDLFATIFTTVLPQFLRTIVAGPNSMRLAQLHHDSVVHVPYLGFRQTANLTSEEILTLTIRENEDDTTNASAVNTGTALWQLYRNEFNTEFDRPNARNVILLFTEGLPQDDVATPAKALRDSGVTIYSYHLNTNVADEYQEQPYLEISSFHDFKRFITPLRPVFDELFFDDLCYASCNI